LAALLFTNERGNAMSVAQHEIRKHLEAEASALAAAGRVESYSEALRIFAIGALAELAELEAVKAIDSVATYAAYVGDKLDPPTAA
jgi:hypothetical protein